MACWMCKCEGKPRPPNGFLLRDLGNNPILQPYLLLSLKHERMKRGQRCAAMCVYLTNSDRVSLCVSLESNPREYFAVLPVKMHLQVCIHVVHVCKRIILVILVRLKHV